MTTEDFSNISADDVIREFGRINFKHVNDTQEPLGPVTEHYCLAVVDLAKEVKLLREVAKHACQLREAQKEYMANRGNEELGKRVGQKAALVDGSLYDWASME